MHAQASGGGPSGKGPSSAREAHSESSDDSDESDEELSDEEDAPLPGELDEDDSDMADEDAMAVDSEDAEADMGEEGDSEGEEEEQEKVSDSDAGAERDLRRNAQTNGNNSVKGVRLQGVTVPMQSCMHAMPDTWFLTLVRAIDAVHALVMPCAVVASGGFVRSSQPHFVQFPGLYR